MLSLAPCQRPARATTNRRGKRVSECHCAPLNTLICRCGAAPHYGMRPTGEGVQNATEAARMARRETHAREVHHL